MQRAILLFSLAALPGCLKQKFPKLSYNLGTLAGPSQHALQYLLSLIDARPPAAADHCPPSACCFLSSCSSRWNSCSAPLALLEPSSVLFSLSCNWRFLTAVHEFAKQCQASPASMTYQNHFNKVIFRTWNHKNKDGTHGH